jgi:hypothetical protein
MATMKTPSEGGSGSELGHSKMEHWTHTNGVKEAARIRRRRADRAEAALEAELEGLPRPQPDL